MKSPTTIQGCPYGFKSEDERPQALTEPEAGHAEPSFVALSKFAVANGLTNEVKQAFIDRPHLVDHAPGYVRMEVLNRIDAPDELWLLTYWRDEMSYKEWHGSHDYHETHKGIPKGLKLVSGSASILLFNHVCS